MRHRKQLRRALTWSLVASILFAALLPGAPRAAAQIGGIGGGGMTTVIWRDVDASRLPLAPPGTRLIVPRRFRAVSLDTAALRAALARAPMEFTAQAATGRIVFSLPAPDGRMSRFLVEESPIMEPALAARHPLIKTYRAKGIDDPAASARFGITPYGFHAIVLTPAGTYYIDPYRRGDTVNHISYFRRDYPRTSAHNFVCDLQHRDGASHPGLDAGAAASFPATRPNGGTLRTYRLALAANYEYSDFHSDATPVADKAEVLARGILPTVNRVNSIYEREVAVKLVLVDNEDLIIFNTPADPYENSNPNNVMLYQNIATLDAIIGPTNYDIGHVVSTGGGGVAFLGVVCNAAQKGGGVTGLPAPTGDPFYVDYVAHEMGHQFGGNHTFNGSTGSCSGDNRNASTAYEVGSGSTIQAYAGICSPQNLQPNSDPYFHVVSYDEILTHITTEATCSVNTQTGNNPPSVEAGPDFTIPARTAFTLTAQGEDPDGDPLTYAWEEFDLGPAGDGNTDNGTSPILRSFNPTSSPSRHFPKLSDQLNNVSSYGEKLPTTTRELKFRVTVRDNRAGGGGVDYDSMKVNVTASAGPFRVTAPEGGETWPVGSTRTVTWDVANTNAAPVNAAAVDIRLSTDGGQTFPHVLASAVPNDGSHEVTVPPVSTANARVRVTATGNIFYDISDGDVFINPPPLPPVAENDIAAAQFQTPAAIPVLANDTDPDGFPLAIVSAQSPTNKGGTTAVSDSGTPGVTSDDVILYTPPPHFSGADQFTYTVTDGGQTSTATVTVTVAPFCAPLPTGNFLATFESGNDGFTVLTPANAPASPPWTRTPDPAAHSPAFSFFTDNAAVNGGQKADRLISPPQVISSTSRLVFWHRFSLEPDFDAGVLEVSLNGGATYTDITNIGPGDEFVEGGYNHLMSNGPLNGRRAWNGRSPGFLAPAMNRVEVDLSALAGQTAIFRWNFRADDLNLDEAVGWWVDDIQFTNLLVAPPCNEPPFAESQSVSTDEDTAKGITLTANQGDEADALTFTVETGPAHGTLSGSGANLVYTPAANYHGADSFTFRASDGVNASNLAAVSITVASVNDPPQVSNDAATVNEDSGANTIDVLRNDTAAPESEETLAIQSVTQGAHGSVAITGDGALLTYTPNAGYDGGDLFTYTVSDGNGGTATGAVRVTVVNTNGPVNYALTALGSVAFASSTYTSRNYSVTSAFDGENWGLGWEQGGGWNDATRGAWPDFVGTTFGGGPKAISEVRVYTLQNNFRSPVPPDANTDASLYGLLDFEVQYLDAGGNWVTFTGGSVTGNTKAMRTFPLATPVTTPAVRVLVHNAREHYSRIVEVEALGPAGQ